MHVVSLISRRVEVRAVDLLAALPLRCPALVHFVVVRVILLLLPAVAVFAAILQHASVVVGLRVFPSLPIRTLLT